MSRGPVPFSSGPTFSLFFLWCRWICGSPSFCTLHPLPDSHGLQPSYPCMPLYFFWVVCPCFHLQYASFLCWSLVRISLCLLPPSPKPSWCLLFLLQLFKNSSWPCSLPCLYCLTHYTHILAATGHWNPRHLSFALLQLHMLSFDHLA